ncbi:hypothetical protein GE061_007395 [Apolygus lucorum]|uniref:Uncharacterized protein n=1 Tax=Apolygus lucorum TaxID=248454 RepID=A0A6A4J0B5_APOLU|nr:hypothetical protein GE061_007395 [Apolygus lucorum]
MRLHRTFQLLLIFGLIFVCLTRKLSKDDKKKLRKQQPKWKSPKIDEFLEGNVSKKGKVYTYEFEYKNNEEHKTCNVLYKETLKPDGMVESQHKWKCKGPAELDEELKDLVGEDYDA